MKLFIKSLLILAAVSMVFPLKSYADISCQTIYGGGQSCVSTNNIVVSKTVLNPQTNKFVDNLGINDPKYFPGYIATFQINVTNTGNNTVSQIDVKDVLPQYVSFGSGAGNYDASTNTLSFSLSNLMPNETRTYSVVGRILNTERIPVAQGAVVCVVNQAIASIGGNTVSQDNAQFCIQNTATTAVATTKGGFPVYGAVTTTATPSTGAQSWVILGLVIAGGAGLYLRRKSLSQKNIEKI